MYGDKFGDIFKTITGGDNGFEFSDLSTLEAETDTKVYFTHPYSSFEKGTNDVTYPEGKMYITLQFR